MNYIKIILTRNLTNAILSSNHRLENTVIMLMICIILLLNYAFKISHSWLIKTLKSKDLHRLIETVNMLLQELMVLGVISLLGTTLSRFGFLQKINDSLFGENPVEKIAKKELAAKGEPIELAPTLLYELFEDVHIFIFTIMCVYGFVIIYQILIALRQANIWKDLEFLSIDTWKSDLETKFVWQSSLEFWIFRHRYLSTKNTLLRTQSELPYFHEYLSEKVSDNLHQIVELPFYAYFFFVSIALLIWPVLNLSIVWRAGFITVSTIAILLSVILISWLLVWIKSKFHPSLTSVLRYIQTYDTDEQDSCEIIAEIDKKPFVYKNSKLQQYIQKKKFINFQEALFPFGRLGPIVILRIIQILLFFNVVLTTILIRLLLSHTWQLKVFQKYSYRPGIALFIVAVGIWLFYYPKIIKDYVFTVNTEVLIDRKQIFRMQEKNLYQKNKKNKEMINYLKEIIFLQTFYNPQIINEARTSGRKYFNSLSRETQQYYITIFTSFSKNEGVLTKTDFLNILESVENHGFPSQSEKLFNLFSDNEEIKLNSFKAFVGTVSNQSSDFFKITPQTLFSITDVDGDGYIGLDDLENIFTNYEPKLSKLDIQDILNDMSEVSGKQINLEAFTYWLNRVMARETIINQNSLDNHSNYQSSNSKIM